MLQLSKVKHKYGFDRELRASLKNMIQVFIKIPVDSACKFDLQFQQDVLEKYQVVKETKKTVEEYKEKINRLDIEIKDDIKNSKSVSINDLFDFQRGRVISKKFIHDNRGEYPVYSSQTFNNGIIGKINTFDFDTK